MFPLITLGIFGVRPGAENSGTRMDKDGVLVGPNWDANLCGLEVEPLELSQKLTQV
jgi:hypothetical protein